MHEDELEIDEALVRRLLAGQFHEWSELRLRLAEPMGTENAIFRLGEGLAVVPHSDTSVELASDVGLACGSRRETLPGWWLHFRPAR